MILLKHFLPQKRFWTYYLFFLSFIFCHYDSMAYGATYYIPDDFPNLKSAFAQMKGGDTLIIRDGTYTGDENIISTYQYPPFGSESAYTKIMADHDGKVIFDGEGVRRPIWFEPGTTTDAFWEIKGVIFKNSSAQNAYVVRTSHVKFLKCGFVESEENSDSFYAHTCSYLLLEDCYSYGNARYHFHYYNTDYSIIRRCVARHDRGSWVYQVGFQVYDSANILVQNCIFIDGDQDAYYGDVSQYYSFKVPQVSRNNISFESCIALNAPSSGFLFIQAGDNNIVKNCVAWDLKEGDYFRGVGVDISHCTYGNLSGTGTRGDGTTKNFYDNLLYNLSTYGIDRFGGTTINDYNSLYLVTTEYHNTTPGSHSFCLANSNAIDTIDGNPGNGIPALKYLLRIDNGSNLDGKASDGGDIGATILYKIGKDGTLWGEPGYNEVTNEPLWPFPNEELIKQAISQYTYDADGDGVPEITGKRGFCADGTGLYGGPITLTSYIWEYLGNPCASEICNYDSDDDTTTQPDNVPPTANAGSDQIVTDVDGNGSENVVLDGSGSSDSDGSIVSYTWLENGTQIATGATPSVSLNVGIHTITLQVQDNEGATATDTVQITVNSPSDTTPPAIIAVQSSGITATTVAIIWTTDEYSDSRVKYGLTPTYGQEYSDQTLVTSHQVTLTGLTPNTTYNYQVESIDSNGNAASSANYTFTTSEQSSVTMHTLQNFEDGVVWVPGGSQDSTGNHRGWAFLTSGDGDTIEIDSIGANNTGHSLKIIFASDNDTLYFRSDDKLTDHMSEAAGANRMSFYVRFPEGFPIQPLPFRYDTWQLGTYIHDPDDWSDLHAATFEDDHGIHHYYHRLTIEEVGNGWVKYIVTTQPDQANYSGSTVPPNIPHYFDSFGRFYFHFGPEAGGPEIPRPFTIWIDEIKFYHDDGTVGGEIHVGGQDDAGFDGEFIPDSATSPVHSPQDFQAEVQ